MPSCIKTRAQTTTNAPNSVCSDEWKELRLIRILDPLYASFTVRVSPDQTVDVLKQEIRKHHAFYKDIELHFNHRMMRDCRTLASYDVEYGSVIKLYQPIA